MNIFNKRILVVRNDKLGDFMLAWPAFATLKLSMPDYEIHALVSSYTADMARLCPNIDQVIIDPGTEADFSSQLAFAKTLRHNHYDAAITLFSTTRIGCLLMMARIPYRLAPATKIAQIFYHKRLKQRRSHSEKPEYVYNQKLAIHYLKGTGCNTIQTPFPPYLEFPHSEIERLRHDFCQTRQIDTKQALIFIHPGSGGSANNLSLTQFAELGRNIKSNQGHHIVISAGPGEIKSANALANKLGVTPHTVYVSSEGLKRFAQHIAFADLFISGSTGPLHIAGALNCRTAGFYTRRRSATALRWQTINSDKNRLAFSPSEGEEHEDMSSIDVTAAAREISEKFLLD